jgi:hypothetical protein
MVAVDSTVVLRYGTAQAGAEVGYNPKKQGRPSHHLLVAFAVETGDCLGAAWRPGNAHTAAGALDLLRTVVGRLRGLGVQEITVRMDKGFYSKEMVEGLRALGVGFVLKVPLQPWALNQLSAWRESEKDAGLWTASGELHGARLLACEWRTFGQQSAALQGELAIDSYEVDCTALVLTNDNTMHALTAWRTYNAGAVVEQRIEELGQLAAGRTAVDDLGGNRVLWALSCVAYSHHFAAGNLAACAARSASCLALPAAR